jgi:NAD-dependent DNA ligase
MGEGLVGLTVCFTGSLNNWLEGQPITRERAEQLATSAGLVVAPRVTKGLDLLVVADPDTLSSKHGWLASTAHGLWQRPSSGGDRRGGGE